MSHPERRNDYSGPPTVVALSRLDRYPADPSQASGGSDPAIGPVTREVIKSIARLLPGPQAQLPADFALRLTDQELARALTANGNRGLPAAASTAAGLGKILRLGEFARQAPRLDELVLETDQHQRWGFNLGLKEAKKGRKKPKNPLSTVVIEAFPLPPEKQKPV